MAQLLISKIEIELKFDAAVLKAFIYRFRQLIPKPNHYPVIFWQLDVAERESDGLTKNTGRYEMLMYL